MIRNVIIALALICSFAFTQSPTELPPDIRAALERNARLIDPIDIQFTHLLRPLIPKDQIEDKLGFDSQLQEVFFARKTTWLAVDQYREYSYHFADLPPGSRWANDTEFAFDGTGWQNGSPKHRDAPDQPTPVLNRAHIDHLARTEPNGNLFACEYFLAIGLSAPASFAEKATKQPLRSAILKLLEAENSLLSVRNEMTDGPPLVRIEIEVRDEAVTRAKAKDMDEMREKLEAIQARLAQSRRPEDELSETAQKRGIALIEQLRLRPELKRVIWYLDASRGHAVARYEERVPDGSPLTVTVNSDFFQPPNRELWLPRKVTQTRYSDLNQGRIFREPALVTEIELKSADTTPKDPSFFTLSYTTPGSRISETDAEGKYTLHQVLADPPPPEPEPVPDTTEHPARSPSSGVPVMKFAAAACAVVILAAVVIAIVRRAMPRRVA